MRGVSSRRQFSEILVGLLALKLTTRRLILRPLALADAHVLFDVGSREDVSRPAGFPRTRTLAASRARVRRTVAECRKGDPKPLSFSIVLKDGGAWAGNVSLRWPHAGIGQLGYLIHPDYWGRGFATEAVRKVVDTAFARFGAHRVQATCWVKNAGSARVLRKAGLRREGTLRGYLKRSGEVRDEYIWGMTRADWRESR